MWPEYGLHKTIDAHMSLTGSQITGNLPPERVTQFFEPMWNMLGLFFIKMGFGWVAFKHFVSRHGFEISAVPSIV